MSSFGPIFRRAAAAALALPMIALATDQAIAQRDIGATALILDNGLGQSIRITAPTSGFPGPGIYDYVLPIPPSGVDAGFVAKGSALNKYLTWNDALGYHEAVPNLAGSLGTGTLNTLTKWAAGGGTLTNSGIMDDGSTVSIVNEALLLSGTTGATPASGAGTRLMWIPAKAAFRAGTVNAAQWDDVNIGLYSFAAGYATQADGSYSVAMGTSNVAGGSGSVAMGDGNSAAGNYAVVFGLQNSVDGNYAMAHGFNNSVPTTNSFSFGLNNTNSGGGTLTFGQGNTAGATSAIALGINNVVSGIYAVGIGAANQATAIHAVAIGDANTASGAHSVALGNQTTASAGTSFAFGNQSSATALHSTAGGSNTEASAFGAFAMGSNTVASGEVAVALGGGTTASGNWSIAAGDDTEASGEIAFAMGRDALASGEIAFAFGLDAIALGNYSGAMGWGAEANAHRSFAIGTQGSANHDGSIVIADGNVSSVTSSTTNEFTARASGGYRLFTNAALTSGVSMNAGGNSWSSISDSNRKENRLQANGEAVLAKLDNMWLGSWNYKGQDPETHRHYGPMAQEFFAAFGHDGIGVSGTDTTLASADVDGINMIAIQALIKRTNALEEENELLRKQNAMLLGRVNMIENAVDTLTRPEHIIKEASVK